MLFGWAGFTATGGSSASSVGQVPKALNPVLHVPTALGRDSSTSELTTAVAPRGRVNGAVGVLRSLQAASKAAPSRRQDSIRNRYMVTPVVLQAGRPRSVRLPCAWPNDRFQVSAFHQGTISDLVVLRLKTFGGLSIDGDNGARGSAVAQRGGLA